MSIVPWPNPIPGQVDQVIIDGMPLEIVPGKYGVEEADRFGAKVSQGELKYADFNPYESAWAVSALTGGAGLRRYSDAPGDADQYRSLYEETENVNCAFAPTVLSPEITAYTLPGATGPAVWMGEDFRSNATGGRMLAVGPSGATSTSVWQRGVTGAWTTIGTVAKGPAVDTAIGVYSGYLVIGFGSAFTAVALAPGGGFVDVLQKADQPGGAVPIFVWAFTNDHAAAYVAGGATVALFHIVMSSTFAEHDYAGPIDTGDTMITSLAPGGGLVGVYVGKVDALGEIDQTAIYRELIPFDSRLNINCRPLKWMLASGSDAQRGSMTLVFPRERGLWEYAPADQFSGTASSIAPWTSSYRRPPNARGVVTSIIGTQRFLYYAVQNSAGHTWIWRNDQTTGAPHTYLSLGLTNVRSMAVTYLFPGQPRLLFSMNTQIGECILPLDGDAEFDDVACRYQQTGTLTLPDIDLGFPDEDKISFGVRVIADDLVGVSQTIGVEALIDGILPWLQLGTVHTSPSGEVEFPIGLVQRAKRLKIRLRLNTDDPTITPKLWGVSARLSLNTKVYRLFVLQTRLPGGSFGTRAEDLQNPYLQIIHSWNIRRAGVPVPFSDPWNDLYQVRVLKLQQQEALREPDRTPEWVLDWTLLEYVSGEGIVGQFQYDMPWTRDPANYVDQAALYGYDGPLALYDTDIGA
jgi:hypothetical protein